MRKRNHFIGLWLDDSEYRHLQNQCNVSGLTASVFVRQLIGGVQLRPRPPGEYAPLLRELSAIGNNINQIAYWANATGNIHTPKPLEAAELAQSAWRLVKEKL